MPREIQVITRYNIVQIQAEGSIWTFVAVADGDRPVTFHADHRMGRGLCEGLENDVREAAAEQDIEIPVSVGGGALVCCALVELEPSEDMGMSMPIVRFAGLDVDRLRGLLA